MIIGSASAQTENYADWKYWQTFVLNTSTQGANTQNAVDNFPVLIRLVSSSFGFNQAAADGRDIRFASSDGTPLSYAIERWDVSLGVAEIWVKIPHILPQTSNQSIKMYWGKTGVSSLSNSAAVFEPSNSFAGVWHLSEEQTGTSGSSIYQDATGSGKTGKDYVSTTGKTGLIGKGQQFDKTHPDYIELPPPPASMSALTLSAWVKPDQILSDNPPVSGPDLREKRIIGNFAWWPTNGFELHILGSQLVAILNLPTTQWYNQVGLFAPGAWAHVAMTWTNARLKMYFNGTKVLDQATAAGPIVSNSTPMTIGQNSAQYGFDGSIDEVRLCSSARSDDWIRLCYANQKADQSLVVLGDQGAMVGFLPLDGSRAMQGSLNMSYNDVTGVRNLGIGTNQPGNGITIKSLNAGLEAAISLRNSNDAEVFRMEATPGDKIGKLTVSNQAGLPSVRLIGDGYGGGFLHMFDNNGNVKTFLSSMGSSYFTGGNLGLGIMDPGAYRLNVAGDINFTGQLYRNGSPFGYWQSTGNNAIAYTGNASIAGTVGIGGANNGNYSLAVNGKIGCREIIVTNTGWADYVFNKDYKLMPLMDIEKQIKKEGHLPGIPSADSIQAKGLPMGEMQSKLLEKIEQLYLYVIDLKKENAELKEQMAKMQSNNTILPAR